MPCPVDRSVRQQPPDAIEIGEIPVRNATEHICGCSALLMILSRPHLTAAESPQTPRPLESPLELPLSVSELPGRGLGR